MDPHFEGSLTVDDHGNRWTDNRYHHTSVSFAYHFAYHFDDC
jgi:hypothetical protein